MNSEELFARSLKVAPGGVHSPVRAFRGVGGTPVFFKEAEGAYLTSVDGKKYVDFCMSFGPLILGHRDPDVGEEVKRAISTAWSFGACEPYSLELAEWVTTKLPWVEKVRFVSSGTEAVMSALRVARAATGRSKVLKFDGCYHGHSDPLLVKSGSGLAGEATSDSAGVSPEVAGETLVAPLDDEAALTQIFAKNGKNIAVVVIEPLPANYGLLIQRQEFISKMVSLAREHGALVLFDEVISGFRVALGGMAEQLKIKPDLVTYGKVLGGGFPVGCYGGKRELMDLVAPAGPVYQAGTLSANPVGMRAGLATLQKMQKVNIFCELEERTQAFQEQINSGFKREGLKLRMLSYGSLFWLVESEKPIRRLSDIPSGHKEKFATFFHACLKRGLYLAPSGFEVGFLSYAHTPEILNQAAQLIVEAAKEVKA